MKVKSFAIMALTGIAGALAYQVVQTTPALACNPAGHDLRGCPQEVIDQYDSQIHYQELPAECPDGYMRAGEICMPNEFFTPEQIRNLDNETDRIMNPTPTQPAPAPEPVQ